MPTQSMAKSSILDKAHAFYIGTARQRSYTYLGTIAVALVYGVIAIFVFGAQEKSAAYQCAVITAALAIGFPILLGARKLREQVASDASHRSTAEHVRNRQSLSAVARSLGAGHWSKRAVSKRLKRELSSSKVKSKERVRVRAWASLIPSLASDALLAISVLAFIEVVHLFLSLEYGGSGLHSKIEGILLRWSAASVVTIFCVEAVLVCALEAFHEIRNQLRSLGQSDVPSTAYSGQRRAVSRSAPAERPEDE